MMLSENLMEWLPLDDGCEVDEKVNYEEWNENDNKNGADSDDKHILVK